MKLGYIYKITNPNGQIYIGQTGNITKRQKDYERGCTPSQKRIYESIQNYGWINHKFDVILKFDCSVINIDKAEIYFISFFNSFYFINRGYGLNLTKGGKTGSAANMTEESRRKMSEKLKGRKKNYSIEERLKYADRMKDTMKKYREDYPKGGGDWIRSEEHKKRMSEARKGKSPTEETKVKLKEAAKIRYERDKTWTMSGKKASAETKKIHSEQAKQRHKDGTFGNRRKVIQLSMEGDYIKEWSSATEASRELGSSNAAISSACKRGGRCGKYKWSYSI